MDISRFICPPGDERTLEDLGDMHCFICKKIVVQPMQCRDDHMFCKACIGIHLTTRTTCPADGAALSINDINSCRFAEKILSRLIIRCKNNSKNGTSNLVGAIRKRLRYPVGCAWEGKVRDLPEHAKTCAFRTVLCKACGRDDIPLVGLPTHVKGCVDRNINCDLCEKTMLARHLEKHLQICPAASIYCPNHCLLHPGKSTDVRMFPRRDLQKHLEKCPNATVDCEFCEIGCTFRGHRGAMPAHMERTMQQHLRYMRTGLMELKRLVNGKLFVPAQSSIPSTPEILRDEDDNDDDMLQVPTPTDRFGTLSDGAEQSAACAPTTNGQQQIRDPRSRSPED